MTKQKMRENIDFMLPGMFERQEVQTADNKHIAVVRYQSVFGGWRTKSCKTGTAANDLRGLK